MNALTRRGMSKREVERSLRARELDDETVAAELDRLEGVGLIDDMALAQNLVGILQERKGLGRSAIAAELTRRLLAPAAIEYALDLDRDRRRARPGARARGQAGVATALLRPRDGGATAQRVPDAPRLLGQHRACRGGARASGIRFERRAEFRW